MKQRIMVSLEDFEDVVSGDDDKSLVSADDMYDDMMEDHAAMESLMYDVDVLTTAMESLHHLGIAVESSVESGRGMSMQDGQMYHLAVEAIFKDINLNTRVIAVEAFNTNRPLVATQLALEEQKAWYSRLWEFLKKLVSDVVNWIKSFFTKAKDTSEAVAEEAKDLQNAVKEDIVETFVKAAEASQAMQQAVDALDEVKDDLVDLMNEKTGGKVDAKTVADIKESLTKDVEQIVESNTSEVKSKVQDLVEKVVEKVTKEAEPDPAIAEAARKAAEAEARKMAEDAARRAKELEEYNKSKEEARKLVISHKRLGPFLNKLAYNREHDDRVRWDMRAEALTFKSDVVLSSLTSLLDFADNVLKNQSSIKEIVKDISVDDKAETLRGTLVKLMESIGVPDSGRQGKFKRYRLFQGLSNIVSVEIDTDNDIYTEGSLIVKKDKTDSKQHSAPMSAWDKTTCTNVYEKLIPLAAKNAMYQSFATSLIPQMMDLERSIAKIREARKTEDDEAVKTELMNKIAALKVIILIIKDFPLEALEIQKAVNHFTKLSLHQQFMVKLKEQQSK